mmetsp:Transcript_24725/g.72376  ORF Transcript_24725/g.72376 Transcript_24725/m.72376 type:complete len:229 (+) Transcript_24725:1009-1695(+)
MGPSRAGLVPSKTFSREFSDDTSGGTVPVRSRLMARMRFRSEEKREISGGNVPTNGRNCFPRYIDVTERYPWSANAFDVSFPPFEPSRRSLQANPPLNPHWKAGGSAFQSHSCPLMNASRSCASGASPSTVENNIDAAAYRCSSLCFVGSSRIGPDVSLMLSSSAVTSSASAIHSTARVRGPMESSSRVKYDPETESATWRRVSILSARRRLAASLLVLFVSLSLSLP